MVVAAGGDSAGILEALEVMKTLYILSLIAALTLGVGLGGRIFRPIYPDPGLPTVGGKETAKKVGYRRWFEGL